MHVNEYEVYIDLFVCLLIFLYCRVKVRLPDHDFAVGARHLLVPSVMGVNIIEKNGKVRLVFE